jgi:hypothetical protein
MLRSVLIAACAALMFGSAAVAAPPADAQCPPRQGAGLVTPEQRLMMFSDMKQQADSGAVDVEVLRQMQRDRMRAMTPQQRQAYFTGLTTRWNALPAAEQQRIKLEAQAWRTAHPRPEGAPRGDHPRCPPPPH